MKTSVDLTNDKLYFISNGVPIAQETKDTNSFINKHGYPLVDELTPENHKFYTEERGLDIMYFGLNAGDENSINEIKEGVKD